MRIFETQIDAQRFLLQMVAKGYHWWVSGVTNSLDEIENKHSKFSEFYGCDMSPSKKSYRKSKDLANTHFIFAKLPIEMNDGGYIWFLIATNGVGIIRENSKLKDARTNDGRIVWGDYVLYCATRKRRELSKVKRTVGGGSHWSWYIKPDVEKELDFYVGKLLKTAPFEIKGFFEAQMHRPMHHGVRHYLSRLLRRAHHNFTRMYPDLKWIARDPSIPLPMLTSFRKLK